MRGITKVALGFAAATLSLSAGGAIANAQEVPTPPSPTTHTVVHHEPLALAGTIETTHTKPPNGARRRNPRLPLPVTHPHRA